MIQTFKDFREPEEICKVWYVNVILAKYVLLKEFVALSELYLVER